MRNQKCIKSTKDIVYIGRNPSSAPATGQATTHKEEFEAFIKDAFL